MPKLLSTVATESIHRELRRRERSLRTLARRRAALAARVASLDRAIAASGGSMARMPRTGAARDGRSRRHSNKRSLADALAIVLKGRTMSVKEAAEAVRRAGHKTASRHFYTQVNIALIKSGKFRRVSRGKYQAKSNG